ncbi:iron-sulfur cluster assembly scaffold protein [Paracandidimonas lactea]|uniref:iron-sulfur cluster assembly scaffold protein n=1 Tax=Paracandidimonas lactea TaxID=2895524 RepID=UPI001EEFFDC5|nr:iron-sulfur cluster assembly scaffold protein [Paracandidimonas lactea]
MVQDHYLHPRNVGTLDNSDVRVGTGMAGSPASGGVTRMQIQVDESGIIKETRFKVYGCGCTIAAGSLASVWLKGKTLDQALAIRDTEIAQALALPPIKLHCSILAENAIKAAVQNYREKHQD